MGDMPRDYVFLVCSLVCEAIDDGAIDLTTADSLSDSIGQWAESAKEIYTGEIFKWAADMCGTALFAMAEDTLLELGFSEKNNTEARISCLEFFVLKFSAETF